MPKKGGWVHFGGINRAEVRHFEPETSLTERTGAESRAFLLPPDGYRHSTFA